MILEIAAGVFLGYLVYTLVLSLFVRVMNSIFRRQQKKKLDTLIGNLTDKIVEQAQDAFEEDH